MKITINTYKQNLKGSPKAEKLDIIKQELINRSLLSHQYVANSKKNPQYFPTSQQLEKLKNEIERNVEAYESETTRKELIPYMYDRDLNWFFNTKNIPAQEKLVIPTFEYFNEGYGSKYFKPLDFLNLLEKQREDLSLNLYRPFDIINNIKSIPLSERERHILFGFLLKWFGGYPVNNLDEQVNTVLKLIEKEFLSFPEHTPEKEFCSIDLNLKKQFGELSAHLNANTGLKVETPGDSPIQSKYNFPESHYIDKVLIDFGDLPYYVTQRGIIWRFENKTIFKESDYLEWQDELEKFLKTIPIEYRIKALEKGIEYGKKVYKYHLENACTNPSNCSLNQSWERRLVLAEELLKKHTPTGKETTKKVEALNGKKIYDLGFLIHGQNQELKLEVARFLEKDLNRKIIILHEQPNKGKTIIEKFEGHSNVDFAVALWTADDLGNKAGESDVLNKRARQNVIFETGFFIGKIGREYVIVLYEQDVEIPSDYSGVIFISLSGNWKNDLRKELDSIYVNQ